MIVAVLKIIDKCRTNLHAVLYLSVFKNIKTDKMEV